MVGQWTELLYCSDFEFSKHFIIFKQMRHPVKFETKLYIYIYNGSKTKFDV
jgi:hypothetical protein